MKNCNKSSRGIALPLVLMFLVIITIIGTIGIRRSAVSEKLTRNLLDGQVARQAAEAALRDGERDLRLLSGTIPVGALCSRGDLRPVTNDTLLQTNWTADCASGQCWNFLTYPGPNDPNFPDFKTASSGNPDKALPWYPDGTNSLNKGGMWDGTPGAGGIAKPVLPAGTNCAFKGAVPLGAFTGAPPINAVAKQPEYLLEYIRRGSDKIFRITSRGFGADVRTEVVLQAYFYLTLP